MDSKMNPRIGFKLDQGDGEAVVTSLADGRRCFEAFQQSLQPILGSPTVEWNGFADVVKIAWMEAAHAARMPPKRETPEGQGVLFHPAETFPEDRDSSMEAPEEIPPARSFEKEPLGG